ncbi:helix-turn-helix domain-containing protein [Consotaella aegiceratis]|uniref:helix-turn-helix domain-containing protein n=1 Tax=Consotaella aegiceratis TaxID=3097961 RepID=UPI003D806A50
MDAEDHSVVFSQALVVNLLRETAKMQATDWGALRFLLAVAREGSYAAAGRALKVDPTTIARRLTSLESTLKSRLFEKDSNGRLRATEAGEMGSFAGGGGILR